MFKSTLLSCCALIAMASSAFAADLPTHKEPPPAPYVVAPVFSWTGGYVGVNGGYADPTANLSVAPGLNWTGDRDFGYTSATSPGIASIGSQDIGLHGFIGGAQAGYNYQFSNIVLGVEGDADYMRLQGSYATPTYNGVLSGTYSANGSAGVNSLFTLRARVGMAFDRLLVFATGGVAITDETFNQSIGFNNRALLTLPITNGLNGYNAGSVSNTVVTGVVGGGLEYAFDSHWSVKGEYLYVPLMSQSFTSTYTDPTDAVWTIEHHESLSALNVFRAGLNYRF